MEGLTVTPQRGEVVTDLGRLRMLPRESVIREPDGSLLRRSTEGWACPCGVYPPYGSELVIMPAEVLWIPVPANTEGRNA